jgi:hypothetical protein
MKQELQQATGKFINGWHKIENTNGYTNFINIDGEVMSNQWFDNCRDFREDYAAVCLNQKWNFINVYGEYLSDQWFDMCWSFDNGFAYVKKK